MAQGVAQDKLYRSSDALVAGVCAGIAERHDMDSIVVRILAILTSIMTLGLGIVAYVFLWVTVPKQPRSSALYDVVPASAESSAYGYLDCLAESRTGEGGGLSVLPRLAIAVALMLLFLVVAVGVSPMVPGTQWWQFWPIAPIIVGLCLIVVPAGIERGAMWYAVGIVVLSLAATMLPLSLGIFSWDIVAQSAGQMWLLLVLAAVLFAVGVVRDNGALTVIGAFCITAFCLVTLLSSGMAGDSAALIGAAGPVNVPDLAMFSR